MKIKLTTLALFAAGLLAGLTLTAPAIGADTPTTAATPSAPTTTQGAGARDPISALSATSITVGPLTCSIGPKSPSVPFKVGDRVKIGCLEGVLAYVVADGDAPATPTNTTTTPVVTRSGTLTAIGERTLTVDGLTCYLYPASPSLVGFKVGDRVGIACQANALLKIVALAAEPKPVRDEPQTSFGPIRALSATSITVDGLTCSIGSSSPSVAGFKVGDKVRIACVNGVLVKIGPQEDDRRDDPQTSFGPIRALSATSITVDGLICSIGSSSPSVAGFNVGDKVRIACVNGVLVKIGPREDGEGGLRVAVQLGRITALSRDRITVGQLICKLAATSPSVSSYEVGDKVGIGCLGRVLFMIGALPNVDPAPKVEFKRVHQY